MSSGQGQDRVRKGDQASPGKRQTDMAEPAGSPDGSQASHSSSTRRNTQRIVELLPEIISRQTEPNSGADGQDNWMIRAEFYHEDIGAEDERMSPEIDDEVDGDDNEDQDFEVDEDDLDEVNEVDYGVDEADDDDFDEDDDMGFVLAPGQEDTDDDEEDDENEGARGENDQGDDESGVADYDTTLPMSHRYLGDNFQDSGGTQVFLEHTVLSMPLFNMGHIVPLPGQLLPIKTTTTYGRPNIHESLRDLINRGTTLIGLMSNPRENPVGTTAEIRSYCHEGSELALKLEGRQRFRLMSQPFETTVAVGSVKILPEICLGRPYLLPPSRRKLLLNKGSCPKKTVTSRHPLWVLEKYELASIVSKVLGQIQGWYSVDLTTRDPNDLSYWVASNLPLSNYERMRLLEFNCTEQRLIWLLQLLERSEFLGCANCGNVIGDKASVFAMSCSGPQTSFVNEGGFVHDTLTVRRTQGLIREVEWSTACCWFPGYKWSIVSCDVCNYHIGWCYKSLTRDTRPRKFYGLSRANVRLLSTYDDDSQAAQGE